MFNNFRYKKLYVLAVIAVYLLMLSASRIETLSTGTDFEMKYFSKVDSSTDAERQLFEIPVINQLHRDVQVMNDLTSYVLIDEKLAEHKDALEVIVNGTPINIDSRSYDCGIYSGTCALLVDNNLIATSTEVMIRPNIFDLENTPTFTGVLLRLDNRMVTDDKKWQQNIDRTLSHIPTGEPIAITSNIFETTSLDNPERMSSFAAHIFNSEFYYVENRIPEYKLNISIPTILMVEIFSPLSFQIRSKNEISQEISTAIHPFDLYANTAVRDVAYKSQNNELFFQAIYSPGLSVSSKQVDGFTSTSSLETITTQASSDYIARSGAKIIYLPKTPDWQVIPVTGPELTVYEVAGTNAVTNDSFEDELWQEKVGNCNNFDDLPILDMVHSDDSTAGGRSLELSATRHTACTNASVANLKPEQDYLFSFDYRGIPAEQAGFYLSFSDATSTVISRRIPISDDGWDRYETVITTPTEVTNPRLYLYAYSTDEVKNNVVRYDNVEIRPISKVATVATKQPDEFVKVPLPDVAGEAEFVFSDPTTNLDNLIKNGDLSAGLWQSEVGNCNNYDDFADLSMRLVTNSSNNSQALELEAVRHTACTGPTAVSINEGRTYLLSFDYQSDQETSAGFHLGWGGTTTPAVSERMEVTDGAWQTFNKQITAPPGVTSASLLFYAYENDGVTPMKVRYDNISLIELPNIQNRYYLVSDPQTNFVEPRETNFTLVNSTKKLVSIKGATTPFYLAMSESFHPQWQAQFNNSKITGLFQGWVPFVTPDRISDEHHFELNGFLNGWYIDTAVHCEQNNLCTKNPDGSYDIELVLEFFPQRWFYLGLLISGTMFVSLIGYLLYDAVRRRRERIAANNQII